MKFSQMFFSIAIMMMSNCVYAAEAKTKDASASIGQSSSDLSTVLARYTGRRMRGGEYPGRIQDIVAVYVSLPARDDAAKQSVLRNLAERVEECNKSYPQFQAGAVHKAEAGKK